MPLNFMASIGEATAVDSIHKYFKVRDNGRPFYTGSRFETFVGAGDTHEPDKITAEDLLAVSLLSVHVPGQAALGILGSCAKELEEQLKLIPVDLRFEELTDVEFRQYLDKDSPAEKLWKILRQEGDRWGVGQTTTSKILARKRPHLIPIYDSVIAGKTGMTGSGTQWSKWQDAFHGPHGRGAELVAKLTRIRNLAGQPHLSLLRVLDIVLWMGSSSSENVLETVGDEE
ncbi:MAG: DUF6308 family protein [Glutamicibacter ardleyensis]